MTTRQPVKKMTPQIVGVITSPADLRFAIAMPEPPHLFELRLDHLCTIIDQLERKIHKLRAPIIITARDPREGGANNLSRKERQELLSRFLSRAKYVDVELRSARAFKSLLVDARKQNVRRILSFHDFKSTPSSRSLRARASLAKKHGADIFKIACHTDSPVQLARLVDLVTNKHVGLPVSAMGIGKLGALSRL